MKSKYHISPINKNDKDLYDHPAIKPLELVKRHIEHTTQPGDVVADFFLGSGTTAVACQEIKRQFIGFEIDKSYYDIAQDRINGITQVERREKEAGIQSIFDFKMCIRDRYCKSKAYRGLWLVPLCNDDFEGRN